MVAGAQTVSQAVTHSGADLDEGEEAAAALQSKIISVTVRCTMKWPCTCCVESVYPMNTAVSPFSLPLGTFHQEEHLRISNRNSILMT